MKEILYSICIFLCIPFAAYMIGKYVSVGYFSAKEFMKHEKENKKK
jgi:hypothetical protein